MDEGVASGGDESPRKKQKGKDRAKRRQKRLLKSLHENGLDIYHESSSNGADTLQELTNGTQLREKSLPRPVEASSRHLSDPRRTEINRDAKTKEAKDEVRRDSNLAVVTVRTSLGSNREALLQSILKGCSPDKLMNVKAERSLPSESESGDASAAPNVASAMKTSSKGRSRPRVSMVPVLPEGYKPSLAGSKSRFHCPVEGCDKLYTRKTTLGEHMNVSNRPRLFTLKAQSMLTAFRRYMLVRF